MTNYIFLKSGRNWIKFNIDEVIYIKSSGPYCQVVTIDKKEIVNIKIGNIISECGLDSNFIRIHKRYIINIKFLHEFNKSTIFLGNYAVPIGKKYAEFTINKFINSKST